VAARLRCGRKLRYRGTAPNHAWFKRRTAAPNLRTPNLRTLNLRTLNSRARRK
jgi:hypothetical protein